MRVLVTGGSGFIGTNLITTLLHDGAKVLNLDIVEPRIPSHRGCWENVNILDHARFSSRWAEFNPTHVYHLAATTDLNGKEQNYYATNIEGVRNVANLLISDPNVTRCVFASSRLVCDISYYPENDTDYYPTTTYGESKVRGEKIVRETLGNDARWFLVRPTSIWGPWFEEPYRNFFEAIRKNLYMHPKGKKILKSYGYVGNVIFQLNKLMCADEDRVSHRTFYLMDYPPLDLAVWASKIQCGLLSKPIKTIPVPALRLLGRLGDVLKTVGIHKFPLTTFRVNNLLTNMVYKDSRLEELCGTLPYTLDSAVENTLAWMADEAKK